jgi:hypothetical protein
MNTPTPKNNDKAKQKQWIKPTILSIVGLLILSTILGSVQSPKPKVSALLYLSQNVGHTIYHVDYVSCKETNPIITTYNTYTYDIKCVEKVCIDRGSGEYKSIGTFQYYSEKPQAKNTNSPLSDECSSVSIKLSSIASNKKGADFANCLTNTEELTNPPNYKYSYAENTVIFGVTVNVGRCPNGYAKE